MATYGLPAWPWTGAPPEELPPPEALLLEGMRRWAAAAEAGRPTLAALHPPFVAEDALAATGPLDALLRLAAGLRPLGFGCLLCPRVTGQEARLLLACALAQRGARQQALAGFATWLPPAAAYAAMPPAIHLGAALRAAGLLLRDPLRKAMAASRRRAGR
ncbi:hypothetical protein [Crenalkalicoccus roseus]|uniref:hypothetical protein n=1 Tax=Crenalkalicoccus roseus TaxID=1485588 RepID=UPI001081E13D|nr:hypothetical protein [Crenalkalicoccus roseus]